MKKTLQAHIGGRHFYLNEDAYGSLNHYLDALKSHFTSEGESAKEIVEDIEQRIAELLENKMSAHREAISLEDVEDIIGVLGKIEDFEYERTPNDREAHGYNERKSYRRFYRDAENNYLGGVAAGLGAYFDINPLWIRLAFVLLTVFNLTAPGFAFKGIGILIYLIIWIVVPKARTTAEKLQMHGKPVNLSTIKDSVNTEFDNVKSGIRDFSNSKNADHVRNVLENLFRLVGLIIIAFFKFMIGFIGVVFLIIGSIFLAGLIITLIGFSGFTGFTDHFGLWSSAFPLHLSNSFASTGHFHWFIIALIIVVIIPIAALIYGGIKLLFNIKSNHRVLRIFLLTTWILALVLFISLIITDVSKMAVEATGSYSNIIKMQDKGNMHIVIRDNTEGKKMTKYQVFGIPFYYSNWDEALFYKPKIEISPSEDSVMHLTIIKSSSNAGLKSSQEYFDAISYHWEQTDSLLCLDKFFHTNDENFWLFAEVMLELKIPANQSFYLTQDACELLVRNEQYDFCTDSLATDIPAVITSNGLEVFRK
jgi:phage shock protein PspC (stress-responsive transcriptional regulator)